MPKSPAHLIYGTEDRPPLPTLLLLSIQHIFLMSSTLVLPVALVTELGGTFEQVRDVVCFTMIAAGIGTLLQALRLGPMGSGFLCPNLCGPNFFAASTDAAWVGGLPLMRGMTIAAGIVEAIFAPFVHRLRAIFPPQITGLVVLMVAVGLIPLGASKSLGIRYMGDPIDRANLAVAIITLLCMVGTNIWTRGRIRLYSVLIGMAVGYLLSIPAGLLTTSSMRDVLSAPWIALPTAHELFNVTFDWKLLPLFAVVSICGALKSFGNLVICEKINDEEYTEPDLKRIGRGLLADSVSVTLSGMLGGMATDTSASNVGLSNASGATSRWIGVTAGLLFAVLGLSPKLGAVLSIMPMPVMGAILVYVTSFMIISSLQVILASSIDLHMTFVIGIPLIFGLSIDMLPQMYGTMPTWLRPFIGSSLTFSTILAVVLNQLFHLGAALSRFASRRPGSVR